MSERLARILVTYFVAIGYLAASNVVCAQIPCEYDVQIIASSNDCGGFGTVNTFGLGLNENGAVVGYYFCPLWDHDEAFVWTDEGGFVTLQRPQGVSSAIAVDINDEGVICGTLLVSGLGFRGFVYDKGEWTILDPVVPDGGWSSAAAINDAGTVVGQRSITKDLNPQNAYIWSANEGFTDLGVMNGPNSAARDISDKGHVVGWTGNGGSINEGFLWEHARLTLLGSIPGGFTSTAGGVNSYGTVGGSGRVQDRPGGPIITLGFVWQRGRFTLIDPIPGYDTSGAGSVNADGHVTGLSVNLDEPTDRRGFVWIDGATHDLNAFIPDKKMVLIERAKAINILGQIVSDGDHQGMDSVTFLLTPTLAPLGDLDGDCVVGASDVLILLAEWGQRDSPADLNGDGIVGAGDLLILLMNWG